MHDGVAVPRAGVGPRRRRHIRALARCAARAVPARQRVGALRRAGQLFHGRRHAARAAPQAAQDAPRRRQARRVVLLRPRASRGVRSRRAARRPERGGRARRCGAAVHRSPRPAFCRKVLAPQRAHGSKGGVGVDHGRAHQDAPNTLRASYSSVFYVPLHFTRIMLTI